MFTSMLRQRLRQTTVSGKRFFSDKSSSQGKVPAFNVDGKSKSYVQMIRTRDPEIFPLLACLGAAAALIGGVSYNKLNHDPSVNFDPERRQTESHDRIHPSEGERYIQHHDSMKHAAPNAANQHVEQEGK